MPQTITISKTDPMVNHISVGDDVIEITSDEITFVNDLNPSNEAVVTFYRNGKRKLAKNPIKNFCESGGDTFTVPASSTAVCKIRGPIKDFEYLYTIQASPNYVALDPVMILDRPGKASGDSLMYAAWAGIAGIGAIAGFALGYRWAIRKSRKGAS